MQNCNSRYAKITFVTQESSLGKNESRVINSDSICLDSVWSRTMRYNSIQSYTIFRSITFGYMTNESNTYFCSITFVCMTNDSLYNFCSITFDYITFVCLYDFQSITFDYITFVSLYDFYPYDFWAGDSTFIQDPPQWKLRNTPTVEIKGRSEARTCRRHLTPAVEIWY